MIFEVSVTAASFFFFYFDLICAILAHCTLLVVHTGLANTIHKIVNCTTIRVFPKLTDLTFLLFLYKIDITGFQNQQKNIASTGYWTHNTNPTIRIPATLTTQPPRHLLNRISLNWTWIISGSIEHDFERVWKFETDMDWQIGWVWVRLLGF